ncbi:flavin-containing monooxygenase [Pseudonocardia spinosispora]|uniref:flavin-containing monooxygenase n=1 Tax=Pseudonocardia spinosispora TaxID=103441 RepID=UPI000428B677|nr:alpha/beta hydrolase fold domain-containing protein [Pseudonocardia spinosispora]
MRANCDVMVIGAGFSGLYAVHKLRDELGLSVQGFDRAGGPGGTWWWNRYPGARCDIESVHYSYSFSDEIQREWQWTERFPAQPEILSYLEFVADKLDVRREFAFATTVSSIVWDDEAKTWTATTDSGETCTARFVIAASGNLSVAKARSEFPGLEDFPGEVYATSTWPHEGVDFTGKRVGVIGTGSTGIQVIPEVARQAEHVTVFQRTPNYAVPLRNAPVDPDQQRWNSENWRTIRAKSRDRFLGAPYEMPEPSALAASPENRRERYDRLWAEGGFRMVVSSYGDLLTDERANETAAEYIREKIRERVTDPVIAELLCPDDHPYGSKRAALETDYYLTFNRDNVDLVDVRSAPIQEVTATGVRTSEGEYPVDTIVLATGFDAVTGPLVNLGLVGRDGATLAQRWADGPKTYLGISVSGFPNLFTITGPQSAVALYNNPLAIEDHVEFAAAAIKHVLDSGASTIETNPEAEQAWHAEVEGILHLTLLPKANSWYMGANVPGKPRATFVFAGGAPLYRAICSDVVANGYAGFSIGDAPAGPVPPMVQLDPAVAMVVGAMLMQDMKPLEDCTLEETRAAIEGFTAMQKPAPSSVRVVETGYAADRPARIYIPEAEGPLPVIVYLHGGGFIAGSLDMCAAPCAALAEELGAIVVTPSYRLAPEAPFPAATDDTYAALCWTAETIAEHGGDPERITVMGESAGGQLAAVAAQRARDENGPRLVAQVLLYPTIDAEADTESRVTYAAGPVLSIDAGRGMWSAYLGDLSRASSPLASPNRAESLAGLPPALVLSAECDPLRDEGEAYGRALEAAGVPTCVTRLGGMVHGAYNMSAYVPRVAEFNSSVAAFLQPLLARTRAAV